MEIQAQEKKRSWWPYGIIASFVALAIYDAGIVTLALRTKTEELNADPYEEGKHFQEIIDAKRAAAQDGVSLSTAATNGHISLHVAGLSAAPEVRAEIELLRPDGRVPDIREQTSFREATNYLSPELKNGLWLLTVDTYRGDKRYRFGPEKIVLEGGN